MSSLLPLFLVLGRQSTCLVRSAHRVATAIHSLTHRDAGIGKRRARGERTSDLSTVPGEGCGWVRVRVRFGSVGGELGLE